MTEDGQLDADVRLPTGYHSVHVRAHMDSTPPKLANDGSPAYFADNYLVPNPNLVLPTHLVGYDTVFFYFFETLCPLCILQAHLTFCCGLIIASFFFSGNPLRRTAHLHGKAVTTSPPQILPLVDALFFLFCPCRRVQGGGGRGPTTHCAALLRGVGATNRQPRSH